MEAVASLDFIRAKKAYDLIQNEIAPEALAHDPKQSAATEHGLIARETQQPSRADARLQVQHGCTCPPAPSRSEREIGGPGAQRVETRGARARDPEQPQPASL